MINVVRTVSTSAAVETPASINRADAQSSTIRPSICFCIFDPLARVLGYFPAAFEMSN